LSGGSLRRMAIVRCRRKATFAAPPPLYAVATPPKLPDMTRILAIETVGFTGSIALAEGEQLIAQQVLPTDRRMAQTLAPAIAELLKGHGWNAREVELVAVAIGPGSFTGLRCGVTTAKVLAYAAKADVVGVDSLQTIAEGAPADCQELTTVLDAQRRQLFAASFRRDEHGHMQRATDTQIVDIERWLAALQPGQVVAGPVLEKLAQRLPAGVQTLPPELWAPRAASVATLAWRRYQAGQRDSMWQLVPNYGRASAAEEKRAEQAL
jgi:tRNA threonylcarbamoyladenosine biosynthesis protein TsaB